MPSTRRHARYDAENGRRTTVKTALLRRTFTSRPPTIDNTRITTTSVRGAERLEQMVKSDCPEDRRRRRSPGLCSAKTGVAGREEKTNSNFGPGENGRATDP